jgi:hypothetical protein
MVISLIISLYIKKIFIFNLIKINLNIIYLISIKKLENKYNLSFYNIIIKIKIYKIYDKIFILIF